jgi:imidazole glycerol-phosphate synthase subunit HisF
MDAPIISSSNVRIIPRLDIKGPNLVKGIHLEGLRVLGKPETYARHYYENGADELLYMDVVASLYGRNNLLDIVERTSKEINIPLTVGGGLRTINDIRAVLRAGADKVSLNTSAINRPALITEASNKFGSSTILVSIEAIKKQDGSYEAYTDNGRQKTGVDVFSWAIKAEELGAGEIMVTSIDREGTGQGYDLELTKRIAESVQIPVIACGGAGRICDIWDVINKGKADAVSMASILHYNYVKRFGIGGDYSLEGNTEYLRNAKGFSKIADADLLEIKSFLAGQAVNVRSVVKPSYPSFTKTDRIVSIVDYGMGNLYSVKSACERVGLEARITSSSDEILAADAVILPGVGAFGDAMDSLKELDLVGTLKEAAGSSKPFMGICLGMQLILSDSYEFGHHKGLDIIKGSVTRFESPKDDSGRILKVPHVGWNALYWGRDANGGWKGSLLESLREGELMYFVHSFHAEPSDKRIVLSMSRYGDVHFCSSFQYGNVFACQFHPERSGSPGLSIYLNFVDRILNWSDLSPLKRNKK